MKAKSNNMINWILLGAIGIYSCTSCVENKTQLTNMSDQKTNIGIETDTATFGTGCFWCTEAIFQRVNGVVKVISGYTGGVVVNPTYQEVCTGSTGHAEACQIIFDTSIISFDEILQIFWKTHDPTTLNRQGNDVGTQYRSAIFYHNAAQKIKAGQYKIALDKSGAWDKPLVTTIEPFSNFYPADNYHQDYYNTNPNQGYCRYVIQPKLEKFEKIFKDKLKAGVGH